MVAGTGTYSTAHSVHLTRAAHEIGVDGFLIVTPYYNKPPRRGIVEHFKAIAAESDRPIVVYNIPGRVAINIEPENDRRAGGDPEGQGRQASERRPCPGEADRRRVRSRPLRRRRQPHLPVPRARRRSAAFACTHMWSGRRVKAMVTAYRARVMRTRPNASTASSSVIRTAQGAGKSHRDQGRAEPAWPRGGWAAPTARPGERERDRGRPSLSRAARNHDARHRLAPAGPPGQARARRASRGARAPRDAAAASAPQRRGSRRARCCRAEAAGPRRSRPDRARYPPRRWHRGPDSASRTSQPVSVPTEGGSVTASVLDGPAEPVFVPGHEPDPIVLPRPSDGVGQSARTRVHARRPCRDARCNAAATRSARTCMSARSASPIRAMPPPATASQFCANPRPASASTTPPSASSSGVPSAPGPARSIMYWVEAPRSSSSSAAERTVVGIDAPLDRDKGLGDRPGGTAFRHCARSPSALPRATVPRGRAGLSSSRRSCRRRSGSATRAGDRRRRRRSSPRRPCARDEARPRAPARTRTRSAAAVERTGGDGDASQPTRRRSRRTLLAQERRVHRHLAEIVQATRPAQPVDLGVRAAAAHAPDRRRNRRRVASDGRSTGRARRRCWRTSRAREGSRVAGSSVAAAPVAPQSRPGRAGRHVPGMADREQSERRAEAHLSGCSPRAAGRTSRVARTTSRRSARDGQVGEAERDERDEVVEQMQAADVSPPARLECEAACAGGDRAGARIEGDAADGPAAKETTRDDARRRDECAGPGPEDDQTAPICTRRRAGSAPTASARASARGPTPRTAPRG